MIRLRPRSTLSPPTTRFKPRQLRHNHTANGRTSLSVPSNRVEPLQHALQIMTATNITTFSTLKPGRTSATSHLHTRPPHLSHFQYPQTRSNPSNHPASAPPPHPTHPPPPPPRPNPLHPP